MLERITAQDRPLDGVVVVDNHATSETEGIVQEAPSGAAGFVEYLPAPQNVGATGGLALGMGRLLEFVHEQDWIVYLDDDDPPTSSTTFSDLFAFAQDRISSDPRTAGVGFAGGRFDFRTGLMVRVPTSELDGPVQLDHLGGNSFSAYLVAAIRSAGTFNPQIFFGYSELEFGLRLRRARYHLYGHGTIWRERRASAGRLDYEMQPSWRVSNPNWRHYYSLRNLIHILRDHGHLATALRVSMVNGLGKPLANLPFAPEDAVRLLALNTRAIADGWMGRLGRRVEPIPWGPRPTVPQRASGIAARGGR
jgi:GT2 family glycosyltransferase